MLTIAVRAQSLAEIARKEAQRRQAIKTPSKVYTNADLENGPPLLTIGATPGRTPSIPPADARPAPPTTSVAERPVKDEAYWRERMTVTERELLRDRVLLEALQSRVHALTTDFVNRDDPVQRAVIANDRQKALAELERVRAEIDRLTRAIADIEEEARRAGVPPGWLR